MNRPSIATVCALYLALPLVLVLLSRCGASAQAPSAAADALLAARACYVEAEFSGADCRAIVHAMQRRARLRGWTFARMLVQFSAIDADNKRAAFARQLPDGDEPMFGRESNAKWRKLRRIARLAVERKLGTPCPSATGWGGASDPQRPGQRMVFCYERTVNWFYK